MANLDRPGYVWILIWIVAGFTYLPLSNALAAKPAVTVEMNDLLKFVPATLTIKVGQTVEWRNRSLLVHTVTADPNPVGFAKAKTEHVTLPPGAVPFNSGNIEPNGRYSHTFMVPGEYRYYCIPHEGADMVGTVIVIPGG